MTRTSNQRGPRSFACGLDLCYFTKVENNEKDDADQYELSPEQISDMKFDQWTHAIAGMEISDEDMLRITKRFYATGKDKEVGELLARAESENRPFGEVLREHRSRSKQS